MTLDRNAPQRQFARMKVARKSPKKSRPGEPARATLTLSRDMYRKIDELRGPEARSAWLKRLIEQEEQRRERERFAETLRQQYTEAVCRQTLLANEEIPIHEG